MDNTTDSHQNTMQPQLWAFRISLLLCEVIPICAIPYAWSSSLTGTGMIVFAVAFLVSVLVAIISSVDMFLKGKRKAFHAWSVSLVVVLTIPFMSCGLLYFVVIAAEGLSTAVSSLNPQSFNPYYNLNSHPEATQPSEWAILSTPMPTPSPTASLDYQKNGVLIPNFYRSSQHHRPISGLSLKPNADFGNTFTGQKQFVITATNQASGQAIGIYAIYTEACAAKWQRYPDGSAPDHLAKVGASLLAGDLPYGEYQCIGLQLSAPLKIGQTYISIEPNQAGSPVELAELPQLVNVIEHARPN